MQIWVISDTHFSHDAMAKFTLEDGSPARPGFQTADQWDELIIEQWNEMVSESDRVYHLGDVTMHKRNLYLIQSLKGKKRLIPGNHDIFEVKDYLAAGFKKISGYRVLDNMLLSHIPVHPDSLGRFLGNVHGHTHQNDVDGPYVNVCVEKTDYRPVPLEECRTKLLLQEAPELWC